MLILNLLLSGAIFLLICFLSFLDFYRPTGTWNMTGKRIDFYASDFYNVNGYLCDENLDPLSEEAGNAVVRTQGDSLVRVCVERNEKCVQNGLFLRRIDAFSFFRDDQRQVAVAPVNLPADNGLTEIFCESGSHKCYFGTILAAQFFSTPGTVRGSGAASLQFGSSPTGRLLQEDDDDISSTRGFRLSFEIFPALTSNSNEVVTDTTDLNILNIAAIILGALLMGATCLCIIFVLFCCCRRDRKESQPLPETWAIPVGFNNWAGASGDEENGMFSPPMMDDDLLKQDDQGPFDQQGISSQILNASLNSIGEKSNHSSRTVTTKTMHYMNRSSISINGAIHSNRSIPIESIEESKNEDEDLCFVETVDGDAKTPSRSPKKMMKKKTKRLQAYTRSEDCWLQEDRIETVDIIPQKKGSKAGKKMFDDLSEERVDTVDIPQLPCSDNELIEVADCTKDLKQEKKKKKKKEVVNC